jgi:DNA-binding transcriptional ArsR family regulator
MVVETDTGEEAVSRLFHALADPTRRDIVSRTLDGELSVSALARAYPISLAAVQKHVGVLEGAELVSKHRRGREQIVRTEIGALRRAHQALDRLEAVWRQRIAQIEGILDQPDNGEQTRCQ